MKLFLNRYFKTFYQIGISLIITAFVFQSCATKHAQFGKNNKKAGPIVLKDSTAISQTFYLVSDLKNLNDQSQNQKISSLRNKFQEADLNTSILLFEESNTFQSSFVLTNKNDTTTVKDQLVNQTVSALFKVKIISIPSNHDWQLKEFNKDSNSLPKNNCGINATQINKDITLITINSQWFLEDWDKIPTINNDCIIKNREDFFLELEDLLIKNQEKTVVLAMHHPILSNGSHGGEFSLKQHLRPLPLAGSVLNFFRETAGINIQDLQNKHYNLLVKRVKILVKNFNNVVIASAHDDSLQYIEKDNVKQIITGSNSKTEAARAKYPNDFSYGGNGYATLKIYKNGLTTVSFYGLEDGSDKLLFENVILQPKNKFANKQFPNTFPSKTTTSVYSAKQVKKSFFYKFLFGKHYRNYYDVNIDAKTAIIDTLFGGLTPKPATRDFQSNVLQLIDKKGNEYTMSAVKQNANKFLASFVFKYELTPNEFDRTYSAALINDLYTAVHPYTPLAIHDLAKKINIAHTIPSLLFIPKQKALGTFNSNFGNELYFVENFPVKNKSQPALILSTKEVLQNIRKDAKYSIDESTYIRARLFDILIGDWDRNDDQWRWTEFNEGQKTIYKPISLDHDQAFSKYDGALLSLLMKSVPLRNRQSFTEQIKRVKIMNREPYPLDLALLKTTNEDEWIKQAKYIVENLTDEAIDKAFEKLPLEVQDATIIEIKRKLKLRKKDLQAAALDYFKVLQHTVLIVGTDNKDKFVISKLDKDKVEIKVFQITEGEVNLNYSKILNSATTKKIWVYGLDEEDIFEINGSTQLPIKIRLIGGQNKDSYRVENGKNITIHDYKTEDNSFNVDKKSRILLSDDYEINLYNYKKPKYNFFSLYPNIGFNPDDGVKIGLITGFKVNDFKQDPYAQKHTLKTNYFFATKGYEFIYDAQFPKLFGKWDLNVESKYTSPNFTRNYFGSGNETVNLEADLGRDFNRVRIQTIRFSPSLKKVGRSGSTIQFQTSFEQINVEETVNRFVSVAPAFNTAVFKNQQFAGATLEYSFENYDLPAFPTLGMGFSIAAGWKTNLANTKRNFPTIESKLNFNHKIDSNGKVVLATIVSGKVILNNNYDFYQGATVGGDYDLRGFRNERFLGDKSFYHSSDIRWDLGKIRRNIIPMSFGILGGFDYGRVWLKGENSEKWHQSYGGGLWINGLNMLTGRLTYFKSINEDRARIAVGIGFGF